MSRKAVFRVMLLPLLLLTLAFNIQLVEADYVWTETIYIRADGSVDPDTAPISSVDNVTYTFIDNIYDSIEVQRSNIIINGAGHMLQGVGSGNGFYWRNINNVTIQDTNIKNFNFGAYLYSSSGNTVSGNNITNNNWGVYVDYSSNNSIVGNNITNNNYSVGLRYSSNYNIVSGNNITNNECGVVLSGSLGNAILENNITNNNYGVYYDYDENNSIVGNHLTNNNYGIYLQWCSDNTVSGNNITNNNYGVYLYDSSNNRFYHNNFIDNAEQVYMWESGVNIWDDGYPSGGNYWSDYSGTDFYSGPYQNHTGSDGIGDTPYVIHENNQDNYPLMESWKRVSGNLAIFEPANGSTIAGPVNITFTIENTGDDIEFRQGNSSDRIDLEIEYRSTDGGMYGWGIVLWSTTYHELTISSREKYEQTLVYDPSEYEESVPPEFVGDAPYGQATIRLVHWKQTDEGYGYGEFGVFEIEIILLPSLQVISVAVDIQPQALNLRSRGKWITCYIELPEGYDVNDINVSSILLNNTIPAEPKPIAIGDYDSDGIPDLTVKFNRAEVTSYILANVNMTELIEERFMTVALTITGYLDDGTPFEGIDTIRIIMPMHGRFWRFLETLEIFPI